MQSSPVCELLQTCASGREPQGWEEFVRRYGWRIEAGVRRALALYRARPARELVEELAQEVYCRLLEGRRRRLRDCRAADESGMAAYLAAVSRSVVADHLRRSRAGKRRPAALVHLGEMDEHRQEKWLVAPGASPEERLLSRERRRIFVERCRQVLGGRQRARNLRILHLAVLEGWSSREISRTGRCRLSASSIDSLLYRMKRRLAAAGIHLPRR